jgi:transposase
MACYSRDLRERVLKLSEEGLPSAEVAERLRVSRAWVDRMKQRYRETGTVEPRKVGGYRKSPLEPYAEEIQRLIKEKPDRTLRELRDEIQVRVSLPAMWNAVKRLGYTLKKTPARR